MAYRGIMTVSKLDFINRCGKLRTTCTTFARSLYNCTHVCRSNRALLTPVCRQFSTDKSDVSSSSSLADDDILVSSYASSSDDESGASEPLYPDHIPTTSLQKILLSVGSALVTISDPSRGDMLATYGEASGYFALKRLKSLMEADPVGQLILEERPRINTRTVDLQALRGLDEGTFGKSYVTWLDDNGASPDARLPVQFVDDVDLHYVMTRYREIHDLTHCLLGMPTNWIGEVTVKVFEGIQTRLPMCVTGAMFGPLRFGPKHGSLYFRTHLPWALRNGSKAQNLMNVYFEKHWEEPITELRRSLNIDTPPYTPAKKRAAAYNS